jgi:transcriptional regulator with XRE-family HTH domain
VSLETFAANVKRLRHERNLTQEALAAKAGLNLTDIARIETLRRDPVGHR